MESHVADSEWPSDMRVSRENIYRVYIRIMSPRPSLYDTGGCSEYVLSPLNKQIQDHNNDLGQ